MVVSFRTDTPLAPGKVAGQWTASGASTAYPDMRPAGSIWYKDEESPAHTYYRKSTPKPSDAVVVPPPPVEPPVAQPPVVTPTATGTLLGGEWFAATDKLALAYNTGGTVGSFVQATPPGIPKFAGARLGLYHRAKDVECMSHARVVADDFAASATVDGARKHAANHPLSGTRQIAGAWSDGGVWAGTTLFGLKVEKCVTLYGDTVTVDVLLTNTSGQTMTDVRFGVFFDPDMDDDKPAGFVGDYDRDKIAFLQDFRRVSKEEVTGAFRGVGRGLTFFLASDDLEAVATFGFSATTLPRDLYLPALYGTPQAIGTARTADALACLVVALGTLEAGASRAVRYRYGVR